MVYFICQKGASSRAPGCWMQTKFLLYILITASNSRSSMEWLKIVTISLHIWVVWWDSTVIGLIIVIDPLLIKCSQDSWKGIPTRLNTCPYTSEMRSYFYRDVCEATQKAVEDGHHKLRVCSCISEFFHFNFLLICLLRLNLCVLPLPKTDFVTLQSSLLENLLEILWSQMGK